MKNKLSNEQFMEWVAQYLDDTIPPEAAKKLLQILQDDPDRLDEFCRQVQMEQLLKVQCAVSAWTSRTAAFLPFI